MVTEEMIRTALERVAERAPDGTAVRAALAGNTRLHRQRRTLVLAGGAAAVTVAAGVPLLWPRGKNQTHVPRREPPQQAPNPRVPLPWRPTWLPEGVVEVSRTASHLGDKATEWRRTWASDRAGTADPDGSLAVSLSMALGDSQVISGSPVSINGRPGRINGHGSPDSWITWQVAPGQELTVYVPKVPGIGHNEAVGLRIARSVVADPAAVCEVSAEFGWLPPDHNERQHTFGLSVSRGKPVSPQTRVEDIRIFGGPMVHLTTGVDESRPGSAEDVTVRGRAGWLSWHEHGESVVYVALDDGRPLVLKVEVGAVHGELPAGVPPPDPGNRAWTRAELLRVVDDIRLGPVPDLGWVGSR